MIGWGTERKRSAQLMTELTSRVSALERDLQNEKVVNVSQWEMLTALLKVLTALLKDLGYTHTWEPIQAGKIEKKERG